MGAAAGLRRGGDLAGRHQGRGQPLAGAVHAAAIWSQAVVTALAAPGCSPARLELEITETVLLHGERGHARQAAPAAPLGVRIAMDDFGTGYSSPQLSAQLPVRQDQDRPLVRRATLDAAEAAPRIVRAVVGLARSLGMATTAEGVETAEQLAFLRRTGCEAAQGFHFSHPLTAADVLPFLATPAAVREAGRARALPGRRAAAAGASA